MERAVNTTWAISGNAPAFVWLCLYPPPSHAQPACQSLFVPIHWHLPTLLSPPSHSASPVFCYPPFFPPNQPLRTPHQFSDTSYPHATHAFLINKKQKSQQHHRCPHFFSFFRILLDCLFRQSSTTSHFAPSLAASIDHPHQPHAAFVSKPTPFLPTCDRKQSADVRMKSPCLRLHSSLAISSSVAIPTTHIGPPPLTRLTKKRRGGSSHAIDAHATAKTCSPSGALSPTRTQAAGSASTAWCATIRTWSTP